MKADIDLTANGMRRAGGKRGKTGVQPVYHGFAVVPLSVGVVDSTAGSSLVTGYFRGIDFLHDRDGHTQVYQGQGGVFSMNKVGHR